MTLRVFKKLLKESFVEVEKQKIDDFLHEFDGFDIKKEKAHLNFLTRKLAELYKHAISEMYDSKSNKYTSAFFNLKKEIKDLDKKIKRYELDKDMIDTLARTHKRHVFHKHGKLV